MCACLGSCRLDALLRRCDVRATAGGGGRRRGAYHLGELVLERARRAERRALLHGLGDAGEHGLVGMADDGRAPRAHIVDVLVAVNVVRLAALDMVKHDGVAAHRLEGTDGRGHAARHERDRLRHDRVGLGGHVLHLLTMRAAAMWEGLLPARRGLGMATVRFGIAHLSGLHDDRATAHHRGAGQLAASKEAQGECSSVDHSVGDSVRCSWGWSANFPTRWQVGNGGARVVLARVVSRCVRACLPSAKSTMANVAAPRQCAARRSRRALISVLLLLQLTGSPAPSVFDSIQKDVAPDDGPKVRSTPRCHPTGALPTEWPHLSRGSILCSC